VATSKKGSARQMLEDFSLMSLRIEQSQSFVSKIFPAGISNNNINLTQYLAVFDINTT
jgi:hypothetical protein